MTSEDLLAPQRALRARFEDFRSAFERRDRAAYDVALRDFEENLRRWTRLEEQILLPLLVRVGVPGRDPARELKLEYVQVRELTRFLLEQVGQDAGLGDILGLMKNLDRRLSAHEAEMERVYYPAVTPALGEAERRALAEAAPR